MHESAVSRRSVLLAVGLCDLAMMSLALGVNLLPVFLTTLSRDLGGVAGLTEEQLGRIGAVTFAGLVIGILVAGPLADRWGGRIFAVGGNTLVAVGLAVLGWAPNYEIVLAGSFIIGLGAGALDMILSPIVSALQPKRLNAAMNVLHSFYCVGAVGTVLVAALSLEWGLEWRTVTLGLLPMPAAIAIAFLLVPLPPMVQGDQERMPLATLVRKPFFLVTCIAIFLGGATELGLAYWLPTYAEQTLGFSAWTARMASLQFALAMFAGRIGILLLPKRIDPITIMIACCTVLLVLFPLASFAPSNTVALACCVLVGLSGSCLWPSTLAVAADRFPHGGATMFAILAALGNFGGVFMPWVVGAIATTSSLRWGLVTATLCPLLMIVALLWMRRRAVSNPAIVEPAPVTVAVVAPDLTA